MQSNDAQPPTEQPADYTSPAVGPQANADLTSSAVDEDSVTYESQDSPSYLPSPEPVSWQAPEYIQQEKTPLWYICFFLVAIILVGVAVWLGSWTFAILVPVMAVALLMYTHRPPRMVNYVMTEKGLHINDQLHPLGEFKNFGVLDENGMHSLFMVPVKRFKPGLTVYFPTEVGEALVDFLGAYLPMQPVHPDAFDQIIRKLRI